MNELLFFTAVDNGYQDFIPLYVYFANKYNPNSKFEFLVKNLTTNFQELINNFNKQFNVNILLRNFNYENIKANQLRFLEEPKTKCTYTYIGDIDIFINENILPFHINQIKEFNTIYSNCLRYPATINRMSGLHFVKTNEYYTQTKTIRNNYMQLIIDKKINFGDEILLNNIMCELNTYIIKAKDITDFLLKRPIHGIHISLNRKPFNNKMEFPKKLFKQMFINDFYISEDYKLINNFLSTKLKNILKTCEDYVKIN